MFRLPIEYDPAHPYSRREMRESIEPHVPLLCFFASTSQNRRRVLGLDFHDYDPASRSIGVLVIPPGAVKRVLAPVHGRRFEQAYRSSQVGRNIIVTFSAPGAAGWFEARWQLDEGQVFASGSGSGRA